MKRQSSPDWLNLCFWKIYIGSEVWGGRIENRKLVTDHFLKRNFHSQESGWEYWGYNSSQGSSFPNAWWWILAFIYGSALVLFQQQEIIDSAVSIKWWSCLDIVLHEPEWAHEKRVHGGWHEQGAPFLQDTVGRQVPCVAPSTVT